MKPFGIIRSDLFQCERENKTGYNSSILIWNSDDFESVYLELKRNFETIRKFIVRFDYWLEMMVIKPVYIQDEYKTQIVDYVSDCQEKLPENSRIVCFPRYPKPHESTAPWIKDYWIDNNEEVATKSEDQK